MSDILGINLSVLKEESALKKIEEYLNGREAHFAVTPNPEIILASLKDKELADILNRADLSFADGVGLKLAGLFLKQKIIRITGADLSLKILELVEKRKEKVLIINWDEGLSKKTDIETALQKKYPKLDFSIVETKREIKIEKKIQENILTFAPSIIFSTLGSPYQEKIIYYNLKTWPSVKFAIGVGGTFDFMTSKTKRAPKIFCKLGLEWLWRLLQQPKRIGRIYRATCVFAFQILLSTFRNKR
ncbi:MAG: WecB/TagA/CpsF family glycosyltransferase [Patescibacteria group bacterium]